MPFRPLFEKIFWKVGRKIEKDSEEFLYMNGRVSKAYIRRVVDDELPSPEIFLSKSVYTIINER